MYGIPDCRFHDNTIATEYGSNMEALRKFMGSAFFVLTLQYDINRLRLEV